MEIVIKKLADLKTKNINGRLHDDKKFDDYVRSIELIGQLRPIVIDENNNILSGKRIFETLLRLNRTTAACYVAVGLNAQEKESLSELAETIFDLDENILLVDSFTCPHCGLTFTLEQLRCREKQKDPADTTVARN